MEIYSCGKNLWGTLDDDGTLTIDGTGDMNDYLLFSDNVPPWSPYRNPIRNVVVMNGVKTIGEFAFANCGDSTNVTIGNSVTTIGYHAFTSCSGLTSLIIPDSVKTIGGEAFYNCQNLTNVTIGNSVTTIGYSAFRDCPSLTNVIIPDSVKTIGDRAFSKCWSLANVTIGNSVRTIGIEAFCDCSNLTSVTIPDSVTSIGNRVFKNCSHLQTIYFNAGSGFESKLSQGNNAKLIPYVPSKMKWQIDVNTLTVGCVREVEDYSREDPPWVADREKIQKLVVENGVKKISAHAFEHCPNLEQLELPASVTNIGDMAFPFSFCGNSEVNGGKNVFWCLEDGILTFKKNPAATGNDFSTGAMTWRVVDKNVRGVKLEHDIKPTGNLIEWLFFRLDGKKIFFE